MGKQSRQYKIIIDKDKVLREVENIANSEKIISILSNKNYFDSKIVPTKVHSQRKNFLEHAKISPIIHSGEYTTSMALDVTKVAINTAIDLIDSGLYSYDLMPHNYTYHNGEWLLYDFGAIELISKRTKTQTRSMFKISFSSFELLNLVSRKNLKHYFLNRISHLDLLKMINVKNWIIWSINLTLNLILCKLKLHKQSYIRLLKILNTYEKQFKREYYDYTPSENDKILHEKINNIISQHNIRSIFGLGEKTAQWALESKSDIKKFVYLDDYETCDKFYNYIYKNNRVEISTSVIYPFMQDDSIDENHKYRGIYDYFAQERYCADATLILDIDEITNNTIFDLNEFCSNITEFAQELLVIKLSPEKVSKFETELKKYFNKITKVECGEYFILVAENKLKKSKDYSKLPKYENENRGKDAKSHSKEIIKIIKNS